MITLSEISNIISNAETIELFINNSAHSIITAGGEIPEYFDDFIVNDMYAVNDTLVICIESEEE